VDKLLINFHYIFLFFGTTGHPGLEIVAQGSEREEQVLTHDINIIVHLHVILIRANLLPRDLRERFTNLTDHNQRSRENSSLTPNFYLKVFSDKTNEFRNVSNVNLELVILFILDQDRENKQRKIRNQI